MKTGQIFVILAPTGAGKTTLINTVITNISNKIKLNEVITYTTRPIRNGEKQSVDYYFISNENFIEKEKKNFFLETTNYNGFWYGSPKKIKDDLTNGKLLILVTDHAGAKKIKSLILDAILIWIDVPDIVSIEHRLMQRNTEDEKYLIQRINLAKKEIELENKENFFMYHIMNKKFETALIELLLIIEKHIL